MKLKDLFVEIASNYTVNHGLINELWNEIFLAYNDATRFYHNMDHLSIMFEELKLVKAQIENWDDVMFSTFYHDIIYSSLNNKNEALSAEYAKESLKLINVSPENISNCEKLILATKDHSKRSENDTNLFLDADMAILGYDWKAYSSYMEGVREEFSRYNDELYYKGRKDILRKFLAGNIYHTSYFSKKYELSAKENIKKEILILYQRT